MVNILAIQSSAMGDSSVSNRLVREFLTELQDRIPESVVAVRNVGADTLPHVTSATVGALRGVGPSTEMEREVRRLSDELITELESADILVLGAPMYNFGIASTLKSWFDHVLRAGRTFRYTENGPEGLLKGKQAIVIETRGGIYSEGAGTMLDAQESHLRSLLGFVGITDIIFVRAEGLAISPDLKSAAIESAAGQLRELAEVWLPEAA